MWLAALGLRLLPQTGLPEVAKSIDFHSDSAQASEDYGVRLTSSLNSLACTGAFTALKHAITAYRVGAFSASVNPTQMQWTHTKDQEGSAELVNIPASYDNSLRTNFAGYFSINIAWMCTSYPNMHETILYKNTTIVAQNRSLSSGSLNHCLKLTATDKLSVYVSLPAAMSSSFDVDVDQTKTYFSIVQV